jgi:lysine-specific demethylase/histidyl-hydroxylase NO66
MSDPLRRMTGLALSAFAADYWGMAPLLRKASQLPDGRFGELLSLDAVDELVSRRGLRTPFARMSRDGNLISNARFTRGGGAGAEIVDQVADDKVLAEFDAGATLVLQGLHRIWPPIQTFAVELSAQLGHPVQVNAYVTPPQNTGFAPHYDVHDVFVLQFAGRKQWRIHAPVLASPLRNQPWNDRASAVAARAAEMPTIDCVLECGDVLYLPRGYIHAASSLGEISGHLTVGVHSMTRHTLVDSVFATLSDDIELRRSLPLGLDLSDARELDPDIDATVAALHRAIDRLDRVAVARAVGARFAEATRPAPLRPLEQIAVAAALTPERSVRLRPGLRAKIRDDGATVVLELEDKEVRLPTTVAEATRLVLTGSVVRANALPGLDVTEALDLLSRLLRDGIVVPA